MIPAFRHMGGKARLRKWLVDHFPDGGSFYEEPFAGKGNVFYLACQKLRFDYWTLSDLDVRFLDAVRTANLDQLPKTVTKTDFADWKSRSEQGDLIAILIEPRVTFAGKGYRYGFSGSSGTHVGYDGDRYREVCFEARRLLDSPQVQIRQRDWRETLNLSNSESFVYLDPPYLGTESSYSNIDHSELIDHLNDAEFSWALSGYRSDLYDSRLQFKSRFEYERNSEIKSSNSRRREPVIETLWTSYEL